MQSDLEKMHVVITGAAGRLGRRLVDGFAASGATVSGIVRTAADGARREAKGVRYFACDLTNEDDTRVIFGHIGSEVRPPDVVIHTVGRWAMSPLLETPLSEWKALVDTNLTSTFLCFREAIRVMGQEGGRLIAFASGQGADGATEEQAAYSAAKAGVIRLVESIDREFADRNVRAFAVAPSYVMYDDEDGPGVEAAALESICRFLCSADAAALGGTVIRAYGDRR